MWANLASSLAIVLASPVGVGVGVGVERSREVERGREREVERERVCVCFHVGSGFAPEGDGEIDAFVLDREALAEAKHVSRKENIDIDKKQQRVRVQPGCLLDTGM